MGIFTKYTPPAQQAATESLDPLADIIEAPVEAPVEAPADEIPPVDTVDEERFDEQRQKLNDQNQGLESLTSELDAPEEVDGKDDDMAIDGTKTNPDAEVAEGDFGREVVITDTKDGVHSDADDSEVKFTSEMTEELSNEERDVDAELDMIEQEEIAIESLDLEISQLLDAHGAIEQFGFNPTAAAIMQTTGLLNGTALESLGLESINFTAGKDAESQMALEALTDKIKEKSAQWSAKILSVAKNSGEKILGVLNPLYTKICGMITAAGSAAWDKAKAGAAIVKAHPFKTIAAVLAAVVAVAGIVVLVTSAPAPGTMINTVKAFLIKVKDSISKVKFPGGTITTKLNEAGTKIVIGTKYAGEAVKGASLDALGWTQTAVKVMGGQLTRAFDAIKHAWSALGTRAVKLVGSAVDAVKVVGNVGGTVIDSTEMHTRRALLDHGGMAAKVAVNAGRAAGVIAGVAYFSFVTSALTALFRLTRFVVVGGFRMIAATLNAVLPHSRTAEA